MAAQQATKPVEDSVPKVNDEIAVGSDMEFQRRWWKFEKAAWVCLTLLLIADLAGLLGRGPLAKARLKSNDGVLDIVPASVEFQLQPASAGIRHLEFRIPGGPELSPTVYVWP